MRNNTVYYASPINEFKGENQVFKNIALNIAKFVYFDIRVTLIDGGVKIEKYSGGEKMEQFIMQAIVRLGLSGFVVQGNTVIKYKEEYIIQKEDAVISTEEVGAIEGKPKKEKKPR